MAKFIVVYIKQLHDKEFRRIAINTESIVCFSPTYDNSIKEGCFSSIIVKYSTGDECLFCSETFEELVRRTSDVGKN